MKKIDIVIIGGGFYGCMLALHFKKKANNVILIEKEADLLTKASYNNQARVHNGYHYPRSFITALRSHLNFSRFVRDFKFAIDDSFDMNYAIARNVSKVTAAQFIKFCKQIRAPIKPVSKQVKDMFNPLLIEDIFKVEEYVFNAAKLRKYFNKTLKENKVKVLLKTEIKKIESSNSGDVILSLERSPQILSKQVFNCAYAGINEVLKLANLQLLPLKFEITEMPLIKLPKELSNFGLTIMDGPFFSIMPFPDKKMHTIHHVRYTPHKAWSDQDKNKYKKPKRSQFIYMLKDIKRFMPKIGSLVYKDSLFELKTILMASEDNDRRPILFRKDFGIPNFHIVMGGKIDNIYDILYELKRYKSHLNAVL